MPCLPMRMVLDFASHTKVADIDIVIASGEIHTGFKAQCDVAAAGSVAIERLNTIGRVVAAGCVAKERLVTVGRVAVAGWLLLSAPAPVAVL